MGASARICCGAGGGVGGIVCDRQKVIARSPPSVVLNSGRRLSEIGKISMSMENMMPSAAVKMGWKRNEGGGRDGRGVGSREKLDEWMRDSVVDIVKNLRETPLLLHVYAGANGSLTSTTASTSAEKAEDWPAVKRRWQRGEERTPEGVIFVEKLGDGDVTDRDSTDENSGGNDVSEDGGCGKGTSAWGIVAQGRGIVVDRFAIY